MYYPGKYGFNRQKSESLDRYVTILRSIHGSENCGAWLFVHKVHFMRQEHVKLTKTEKKHVFSLLRKDELRTRQTIVH